jgi:hypothetical protein
MFHRLNDKGDNSLTEIPGCPEKRIPCSLTVTWLIDWCLTSSKQFFSYIQDETVTWRVSLVEHELFTLPQHLSSPRCFVGSCCSVFSFLCILFSGHPGISVNELSPLSLRRWNIRHFKFDLGRQFKGQKKYPVGEQWSTKQFSFPG